MKKLLIFYLTILTLNTIMMEDLLVSFEENKTTIDIIFVGEEGVGKSSLINFLLNENRAPISDMHTKTWKLTTYNISINNLVFNYHDIPGIEGKYSDEEIASEIINKKFTLVICCLDGSRIRPSGMVRKSIAFIRKFIPDTPVVFVVTKENTISPNEINRINEVKSSVREIANGKFKHFGLVSVGNHIPYSRSHKFWNEIITCIPDIENIILTNFKDYLLAEKDIQDEIQDYFTSNYKNIPEINFKLKSKEYIIKNMKLIFGFFAYLYIGLCTFAIISSLECDEYHIIQIITTFFLLFLILFKLIIWVYSTNYYGIFPLLIENIETPHGLFSGTVVFISKDKYYTQLNGIITIDNTTFIINTTTKNCCVFELCNDKFFEKYYDLV